ncbi:MAG: hypothetical protein KTV77_00895 [Wolbachia endosymbiont of Fragariocoptes setiger]|nr:hypothetical protein [Wolbachia endosymbiont of Fragariocoptes setiger]
MQNKKYTAISLTACGLLIGGGLLYYGLLPTFITTGIMAVVTSPLVLPIIGIIAGTIVFAKIIAVGSKVNVLLTNQDKLKQKIDDSIKQGSEIYTFKEQVENLKKDLDTLKEQTSQLQRIQTQVNDLIVDSKSNKENLDNLQKQIESSNNLANSQTPSNEKIIILQQM